MKKLLLLLLLAPVLGFGQVLTDVLYFEVEQQLPYIRTNPSDFNMFINGEAKNQYTDNPNDYYYFTVPDGKLWQIKKYEKSYNAVINNNFGFDSSIDRYINYYSSELTCTLLFFDDIHFTNNSVRSVHPNSHSSYINFLGSTFTISDNIYLTSGTKFTFDDNYFRVVIYEYSFDNNSFSYNEPETIKNNSNTPVLFPNPTSSLLALNSDKEYDIEVYDMAGNKVMALTGNTIDMSHLSSATYIVKALDKVENQEVSYKVVKN